MKLKHIILTFGLIFSIAAAYAANSTYSNTSLALSNSTGCATSSYTFTQRTGNNNNYRHQGGGGLFCTITFPAGTDATTLTSGTWNGDAITNFTVITATTVTFEIPSNIGKNRSFDIVLNGITNGDAVSGNATVEADNTSSGTNSGTYPFTTTACPSCTDGIQNQGETGVDCGGPCAACPTCSDGIQNQGETGLDCGGPCAPCATCSDGLQNQDETGVDCGGVCPACAVTTDLYNVVANNTSIGVNFLSDMVTHTNGTVTLTQGVFTTNAFEVYTLNKNTMAISMGHTGSFVEGNLRRDINTTGSYHFPVGNSTKGYELANIDFTTATEITNLLARFDDWSPIAAPLNETECGITYDGDPLDHGYWTISADTLDTTGVYTGTLYNRNYTNWNGTTNLTIMRDGGSGYTLRNGICSLNGPDTVIRADMYGFSEFAVAQGSAAVLPANMISFNGRKNGRHNYLYWETKYDEQSVYFEVERSPHGMYWTSIGKVNSVASADHMYDFTDEKPSYGWNYYRLKQVNNDGSTEYTQSVKLKNDPPKGKPVLFPNPSTGRVFMKYTVENSDYPATLEIINSIGQVVYKTDLNQAPGDHNHMVDLQRFGSDLYFFRVIVDHQVFNEKVVIKK